MVEVSSQPQEPMTDSSGSSISRRLAPMPTKLRKAGRRSSLPPTFLNKSRSKTGASGCVQKGSRALQANLSDEEQRIVYATHYAPAEGLFTGVAWKSKPSWYIVA